MPDVGGLLAVWARIPNAEVKDVFDRWYDTEHLPERTGFPGFISALRYEPVTDGERNVAFYELTDPQVFYSDEYQALRAKDPTELELAVRAGWQDHERALYKVDEVVYEGDTRPVDAPVVCARRTPLGEYSAVDAQAQTDVNGVIGYQRFESVEGEPEIIELWGLTDAAVVDSAAWQQAAGTQGSAPLCYVHA